MINHELHHQQMNEGRLNTLKPVSEWKEDDFVIIFEHGFKNCGNIPEILRYATEDWLPYERLCRIQGVIHVATDDDLLRERFNNEWTGGCATDCLDDNEPKWSEDALTTWYTLCTLVISDESGRWLCFDREGYDYNRYVLFGKDFAFMWADVIAEEKRKEEERKEIEHREEMELNARVENEFNNRFSSYKNLSLSQAMKKYLAECGYEVSIRISKYCHISIKCDPSVSKKVFEIIHNLKRNDYAIRANGYTTRHLFPATFGNWRKELKINSIEYYH